MCCPGPGAPPVPLSHTAVVQLDLLGTLASSVESGVVDTLGQLGGFCSYRKTIYGPNVIGIPVKSYLQLLVDEVKGLGSSLSLSKKGSVPGSPRL